MKLPEAVAILNRYYHRGWGGWFIHGDLAFDRAVALHVPDVPGYYTLTPFEALAVAEKYLAERG